MNREILFRGFHECDNGGAVIKVDGKEKHGEWLYGYYCAKGYGGADFDCVQPRDGDCNYYDWEVIPSTVGQFTGLVDKNGEKIFENDIMTEGAFGGTVKVVFEDGEFYGDGGTYGRKINSLSIEETVIGNIFENSELLGGENNG